MWRRGDEDAGADAEYAADAEDDDAKDDAEDADAEDADADCISIGSVASWRKVVTGENAVTLKDFSKSFSSASSYIVRRSYFGRAICHLFNGILMALMAKLWLFDAPQMICVSVKLRNTKLNESLK